MKKETKGLWPNDLLRRVDELERVHHPVYWIPPDGSSLIEGHGYRVAIVIAGEDGYRWTGTYPYSGAVGETMPYFWGPTLKDAQRKADQQNALAGVTAEETAVIVGRSMARGAPRGTPGRRRP